MCPRIAYVLVFIFCFFSGCSGVSVIKTKPAISRGDSVADTSRQFAINQADMKLPDYEKLTYEVRWLGMRLGVLTSSIVGVKNFKGRKVYVLEATMKTNAFFSKIYKIDDRFISHMDAEKLYSLRHEVHRRDGSFKKDAITEFDQVNHKAYFKNLGDGKEKSFDIPAGVQDILSACYYFMLLSLQPGSGIDYYVCNNENNYQFFGFARSHALIKLPVFKKKETEAVLVEPYAKLDGKNIDKGRVSAYFSLDKRRIPLAAIVKGPVFTEVSISLIKIEEEKGSHLFLPEK
ncbi:MAG: hypothetical protein A2Y00_10495 [Omnitrophica WOR_2 bacterium GWF2_43_52]|nr:MAG: hypothetical protein A2062_04445 [Omnitrophica WOR_2 bacterium GWA2_44_7]OGX21895.1 MAG: hypothetical protein A2Y00_10495 [Omnitrophica WOR_2 bacterium GWF2_43_52]OGX53806.1 MAG: hypothetical protein A2460_05965 [Omnitrophica WOR_2 bacterium RIFOXYC2_FULL_43_9]HAH20167.1 hypothetical protein [Candidatus Omnitrophota bacterium]HBG63053.1 hypothetical protein [Candidatus Omnitrophota bacterium]